MDITQLRGYWNKRAKELDKQNPLPPDADLADWIARNEEFLEIYGNYDDRVVTKLARVLRTCSQDTFWARDAYPNLPHHSTLISFIDRMQTKEGVAAPTFAGTVARTLNQPFSVLRDWRGQFEVILEQEYARRNGNGAKPQKLTFEES